MSTDTPKTIYLKDYQAPHYFVDSLDLDLDLNEDYTTVNAVLKMRENTQIEGKQPLVLMGNKLDLQSLAIDGKTLNADEYLLDEEFLTISSVPENFELKTVVRIKPQENTSLEGLYTSSGNYCTQCEPEGFRSITFYPDRPDVMSKFTTTITADKEKYPVLLSNGNLVDSGDMGNDRHFAKWEDPFKKPSYLFALVAGDLLHIEDKFTTMSGREITLRIYVQKRNIEKCQHAMNSLKKSMKWDEETYGREYDLDLFMIVSVDDFNMGAMENKGLNIFNSALVLAKPETATDQDYDRIEGVIGHEYFHNWSGNRVTCRDWFQLSLKEGFTVFRDQGFSGDMSSHAVKRIQDVNILRSHQFPEDAGPLSHPIRPASFVEINNFYTMTIYNKGAEIVRMISTLLGKEKFRKGCDLYFERHDGQAVTTEDFISAMEDANKADFSQFKRWYSQSGTPELKISGDFDADAKTFTLKIKQYCPPTPGQDTKQAFHIPVAVGLIDAEGNDIELVLSDDSSKEASKTLVLDIKEMSEEFTFLNISARPVPSLLRGFSAPVKVEYAYTNDELAFLMANDNDDFNRWEAAQKLSMNIIQDLVKKYQADKPLTLDQLLVDAFSNVLSNDKLDKRLQTETLVLPEEQYIAELSDVVDPTAIHEVRSFIKKELSTKLKDLFMKTYEDNLAAGAYSNDALSIGKRSLKNICLSYLMQLDNDDVVKLCYKQYDDSDNMTDKLSSLAAFASKDCAERLEVLDKFFEEWKDEPLVVDKWLMIQSTSSLPNTLENVKKLTEHPIFTLSNPNKVRALIAAFCMRNPARFHDISGEGYKFLADNVLKLNKSNPLLAARLVTPLNNWRKFAEDRQALIKAQLKRIIAEPDLSKNVFEIVSKSLG